MREIPVGVKSNELPSLLSTRLGYEFDFKNFGCHSLLEFLKKFIIPAMNLEIITHNPVDNDSFIIRSKEFFMNYCIDL